MITADSYNEKLNMTFNVGSTSWSDIIDADFDIRPFWSVQVDAIKMNIDVISPDNDFPCTWIEYNNSGSIISPSAPTSAEKLKAFYVNVTLDDYSVPQNKIKNVSVMWELENKIEFSATFCNIDRDFILKTRPGKTRSGYVTIVFTLSGGQARTFPFLIIKTRNAQNDEISIRGVCELSEILTDPVSFETYTAQEYLARSTSTVYTSSKLTKKWSDTGNCQLQVDYLRSSPQAVSGEAGNQSFTLSSEVTNAEAPVKALIPLSSNWILRNFYSQLSNDNWTLENHLPDFLVWNNIPVQKMKPIDFFKEFLEAVNGEWYIKPEADKLKLVLQKKENTSNSPSRYIPPGLYKKGGPRFNDSEITRFNTISVIKPAIYSDVEKNLEAVITESTDADNLKIINFGYHAKKNSVQLFVSHKVDDERNNAEIVDYIAESTLGGEELCKGVVVSATIYTSHSGEDEDGVVTTIETPNSAITIEARWKPYQGYIPPAIMELPESEYLSIEPYDSDYLNSLEDILLNGINRTVKDYDHIAEYGEIEADYEIVNQMIFSSAYADDIGNQAIIDSAKSEYLSVPMALLPGMKPSDFHRVLNPEMDFEENRKTRKMNISSNDMVVSIDYEGTPS